MKTATLFLLATLLTGCGVFHRSRPSPQPRRDVARFQTSPDLDVYVSSLDGRRMSKSKNGIFELEPGVHTLTIGFRSTKTPGGQPIPNSSEFHLSIDAKVGKTYQLEFTRNGTYSQWSTRIIDASDRHAVSRTITSKDQ
jgi:hypothetical protein